MMSYPDFGELSVEELVASVVREDAKAIARLQANNKLAWLRDATVEDMTTKRISEDRAICLKAAIELGKRIAACPGKPPQRITGPADAARVFMAAIKWPEQEQLMAIHLNIRNRVLATQIVTVGLSNTSLAHPREVFKDAIRKNAASVIVGHNHPSGDPTPSQDDVNLTQQLVEAGKLVEIPLLDHIIVTPERYVSMKEYRIVEFDAQ